MNKPHEVNGGAPTLPRRPVNCLQRNRRILVGAAAIILCSGNSLASVVQGTIIGVFSAPVTAGSVADDPSLGQNLYLDNTGTATVGINNSSDPTLGGTPPQQLTGSSLTWGSFAAGGAFQQFSNLTFFGNQIPADFTHPFQIGTITFSNGTSDLTSLIFGATLSFYDNAVNPASYLGSDQVIITTTSNVAGTIPLDDDYINICGNNSSICGTSIEAVESSEGGTGVTVNLMGTIVGDPMLDISMVNLAAGQNGTVNGFLGADPAIGAITPEPGTWTMLAGALLVGLGLARRKIQ